MEQVKYKYNAKSNTVDNTEKWEFFKIHGEHKWVDGQEIKRYHDFNVYSEGTGKDGKDFVKPIVNKQPMQHTNTVLGGNNEARDLMDERLSKARKLIDERLSKEPMQEGNDIANEYRANFLWGFPDDSIESLGYEFANSKTELYQKECWNDLIEKIKSDDIANGRDEINYAREGLSQICYCSSLTQAQAYAEKYLKLDKEAQSLPIEEGKDTIEKRFAEQLAASIHMEQSLLETNKKLGETIEKDAIELIRFVKHLKYMDGSKPQHEFTEDDILQSFKNNQHGK